MLRMEGATAKARVEFKKAQVRYKTTSDGRMRGENGEILEGYYLWLVIKGVAGKYNLVGQRGGST